MSTVYCAAAIRRLANLTKKNDEGLREADKILYSTLKRVQSRALVPSRYVMRFGDP